MPVAARAGVLAAAALQFGVAGSVLSALECLPGSRPAGLLEVCQRLLLPVDESDAVAECGPFERVGWAVE